MGLMETRKGRIPMDKEYEYQIVKTFFNKMYHERILFELASKKKRKDAIGRLSHHYENVLDNQLMHKINSSDYEEIYQLLNYQEIKICYIISFNEEVDGKYLPMDLGLKSIFQYGMPSLLIGNLSLAYFEGEQYIGPPPRYLLKK